VSKDVNIFRKRINSLKEKSALICDIFIAIYLCFYRGVVLFCIAFTATFFLFCLCLVFVYLYCLCVLCLCAYFVIGTCAIKPAR
jgi:hypothetical protein